jgi:O-antigen/teichoic acid export membrane protein
LDSAEPTPLTETTRVGFAALSRDSAVFSLGSVAGKAVGVLMVPILTRMLSTEQFGQLDILSALATALISALPLGSDHASIRLYFDYAAGRARERFLSSALAVLSIIVIPACVVMFLVRTRISEWIFGTSSLAAGVGLVAAAVLAGSYQTFGQAVLRMQRRPRLFALIECISLVGYAGLAIALLVLWQQSISAVMTAYLASNAVAAVVAILVIRRALTGAPDSRAVRRLARAALPLAPGLIATWAADFAHRAILLHSTGPSQVAFFSVGVRFGAAGVLLATGYQLAWQPLAFARDSTAESRARLGIEGRRIIATVCTGVCLVALIAPEAVTVLAGRDYRPALGAVGWSLLFAALLALTQIASMPSLLAKAFGDIGLATTAAVITALAGNLLLSRDFGASGSAAAIAAGQAVGTTVVWARGRQRGRIPFDWQRLLGWVACTSLLIGIADFPAGGAPPVLRVILFVILLCGLFIEGSIGEAWRYFRQGRLSSNATPAE